MRQRRFKDDNQGAAIVTVLVVTVFISVIATTMLYISAQNYQMKQTDYSNKQSFYGAEETLDELKSLLVADVQDAYMTAYEATMQNSRKLDATGQKREEYFEEAYADRLVEIWDDRKADTGSILAAVQSLFSDEDMKKSVYGVGAYGLYESVSDTGEKKSKFALKGVQVKCTKGSYTTFLYTDICLEAPEVNFITNSETGGAASVEAQERETIALTDYVIYMNWRKADYDTTYDTNLGTASTQTP